MRADVVLRDPTSGASIVVAVSAPNDATAAEVAAQLGRFAGNGEVLYVGGAPLAGDTRVGALNLGDGALIGIGGPVEDPPAATGLRLQFQSGPRAGTSLSIPPGSFTLGRGDDADIVLPDTEASRQHARITIAQTAAGWSVEVTDLGSTNGTGVDGIAIGAPRQVDPGQIITIGRTRCTFAVDSPPELETLPGEDGTLSVRFQKRIDLFRLPGAVKVAWPSSPTVRDPTKFPVVALLLPLVFAVGMAVVMNRMYMLAFAVMSPVMGGFNYFSDRRQRKRDDQSSTAGHAADLQKAQQRVADATAREYNALTGRWPSLAETVETARTHSGRLWQRRLDDDDALEVRVGVAHLPTASVTIEAGRDATPPDPPVILHAPVGVSLRTAGSIGVQGPDEAVRGLVRSLVLQLASYHSPHELTMTAVFRDGAAADFEWVRWLPHLRSDGVARIGNTFDTSATQVGWLAEMVADRLARREQARGAVAFGAHVLVVEDTGRFAPELLDRILEHGPSVGVHCIVAEQRRAQIPKACGVAVNLDEDLEGVGWSASVELPDGSTINALDVETLSSYVAEVAARSLARLRPMAAIDDRTGGLPDVLRMLDHLGLRHLDADDIVARWRVAPSSTVAVLGESATGPVAFDFAATPHGLLAGTTGTGKSQLLITLVASLAAANSPEHLNLVLVDFKGGGAFHRCAELPHTVAMITNLSGGVERTVQSLKIELERRESLFAPFGAELVRYESARQQDPTIGEKVARLVIVIDEFAEFIGGHDDLEEELETLARKGRSLGVHLVLGTQAPSQAIRGKIDAQLEMGIALRLKDATESTHVLKDPAAAALPTEPRGRAYMRTSGSPLAFQVATLGLPVPTTEETHAAAAVDRPWSEVATPPRWPDTEAPAAAPVESTTDLDVFVDLMVEAAARGGLHAQASPVPPVLPVAISMNALNEDAHDISMWVEEHLWAQRNVGAAWAPRDGNLLVVGSPGAGRTTALRTVAGTLAATGSADDLHIHALDFEGALGVLEELPHVGTVADRNDRQRLLRFVAWLESELTARQELVTRHRVGTVAALHGRIPDPPPQIVLLVDRWEVVQEDGSEWDGIERTMRQIFKTGPPLGVTSVVSTDLRRLSRIRESMQLALALRLTDRSSYAEVLAEQIRARDLPSSIPAGRAYRARQLDADRTVVIPLHFAHLGSSPEAGDQNDAISYIASHSSPPAVHRAYRIEPMPTSLTLDDALELGPPRPRPSAVPAGVGGDRLSLSWYDLDLDGVFLICGSRESGRPEVVAMVGRYLRSTGRPTLTLLHGPERAGTAPVGATLRVADFTAEYAEQLDPTTVVLIDDVTDVQETATLELIERMIRQGHGPRLVIGADAESLRTAMRGLPKTLMSIRTGLLVKPERAHDGVLGLRLSRMEPVTGPRGRALLVLPEGTRLVQAPIS